jgi:hypothetical protein
MWRLALVGVAIPALGAGCSTDLRSGSGPDVSVSVTKAGGGELVAHLSSETWPSCAKTLRVSLDGREALRDVPVTGGRFDFALHASDGDVLAIQSACREYSTSALNDWSTVIHGP